ncbi:hypothetical protein ACJJTC_010200 [Scirpophaga incertulas]
MILLYFYKKLTPNYQPYEALYLTQYKPTLVSILRVDNLKKQDLTRGRFPRLWDAVEDGGGSSVLCRGLFSFAGSTYRPYFRTQWKPEHQHRSQDTSRYLDLVDHMVKLGCFRVLVDVTSWVLWFSTPCPVRRVLAAVVGVVFTRTEWRN